MLQTGLKKHTLKILSADKNMELMDISYTAGGNAKMDNHFEKLVGSFLSISLHLLYNPLFQLLDIYIISMMTYDDMSTWKLCINIY